MESPLKSIADRAAKPVMWLVVIGMAYTLANTLLFVATARETAPTQTLQAETRKTGTAHPSAGLNDVMRAHLFGEAGANAEERAAAAERENLVETRLPLVLHGVFVAEDAGESSAILARKGRPEELYHIGDPLPGNATLDAVRIDHVLLLRGRSRERLAFPNHDKRFATPTAPAQVAPAPRTMPAADVGGGLSQTLPEDASPPRRGAANADETSALERAPRYRERLADDPQKALGELGLAALSGDGSGGYRLNDLARSPYLRQTGLQPGDVILSINGQPVGDVQRGRLELGEVLARGSAQLEVQRGQRRFFITASLN